ncbi:MAG TPA: cytochrome o ubiquinol oxidase subunit III [Candidatus Paceibacterota bacterium]|nr:cytochrome o ubiquinol oxidase subunit III [Candidatus Paceibacterota bacterium]
MKEESLLDKVTFGFWVYLMSDCVLFAGLFATYAVLQDATFGRVSIETIVDLPFVLLETVVLLSSSFTAGIAVLRAREGKKAQSLFALAATWILGFFFILLEGSEFVHLVGEGSGPGVSAFLSSFFVLLGTHGLHVSIGLLWMLILAAYIWRRGFTDTAVRRLTILSLFWHFLDIIWIFIFTFVYLFGSL